VGRQIVRPQETLYAVLYKPRGFVCTADDEKNRRTIFDLLPPDWPRVYHVGRLDLESEGLLILTNDGDLALRLTHPRFKIEKEYEVTLDRPFDPMHREKLLRGFHIEGGRAKMEEVQLLAPQKLRVILNQGIKRQIRLMLYDCGYEVERLRRVRIGPIWIEKLRAGMWRMLSPKDVSDLREGRSGRRREDPSKKSRPLPRPPEDRRPSLDRSPRSEAKADQPVAARGPKLRSDSSQAQPRRRPANRAASKPRPSSQRGRP
jgi:23S rRNA pseudouridine2605 synthase